MREGLLTERVSQQKEETLRSTAFHCPTVMLHTQDTMKEQITS